MNKEAKKVLKQFQCDHIRRSEEVFAQTLAENEQVRLFFINENQAFTDGRNIVVDPALNEIFCDKVTLERTREFLDWPQDVLDDMWNVLRIFTRAQTIHECLHLLYTDFPAKAASEPICNTKLKKKILALICNIIEDAYIEAVGCSVYDNMEFYLRFARAVLAFASQPSEGTVNKTIKEENEKSDENPEIKRNLELVMDFLNFICTDLLYPMSEPVEPQEELKPYIEQSKPLYTQASMASSPDERYDFSKQIYEIILPLIPDIEIELDDKKLKKRISGYKTHDVFSSSIDNEPHKGRVQKVTIRLFTDAQGNKRDDNTSLDQIMAAISEFAKDKEIALSIQLIDGFTVITSGEDYDCSNLHKGISINEIHPKVNLNMRKAYQNFYNKYKININSYNGRISQIFKDQVSDREDRFKFGAGIVSTRLGDPQKRYWYRNMMGIDVPKIAIMLLIDGSGSMYGLRRNSAIKSSIILHEVLKKQDIMHAIVEHRAQSGPEIDANILLDFNAREEEKYNLMKIDADGNSRDGLALYWAERYILKQADVDHRVIIVISDGFPLHSYDEYLPPISIIDTANAVRNITRRGTDIVAISLDEYGSYECYDQLKQIYPNLIACNDLSRLTSQIFNVIAKLLSK